MNKLLLIFLLSILILYAQCAGSPCTSTSIPETETDKDAFCASLETSVKSKECVKKDDSSCEEKQLPCPTEIPKSEQSSTDKKNQFCEGLKVSVDGNKCQLNSKGDACVEKQPCSTTIPDGTSDKAKFCEGLFAAANKICQLNSKKEGCEEVAKPTNSENSGSILNAFKITFTLIIIFAIL